MVRERQRGEEEVMKKEKKPFVGYRKGTFYEGQLATEKAQQKGQAEEGLRGQEAPYVRYKGASFYPGRISSHDMAQRKEQMGRVEEGWEKQQVPEEWEEFAVPPERFEGEESAGGWEPERYQKVTELQRLPEKDTEVPVEGHEKGPESIRRSVFGGMPGVIFCFIWISKF
jgi:hypothetical protein